jgi:hypothetical protein
MGTSAEQQRLGIGDQGRLVRHHVVVDGQPVHLVLGTCHVSVKGRPLPHGRAARPREGNRQVIVVNGSNRV